MLKLIYDGDIGPDPCDFSTLSVLHEYHEREMVDLIGVIGATPDPYLASTFSIYNQTYGHDVPIGAYRKELAGNRISGAVEARYYGALQEALHEPDPNRWLFDKYGNADTKTSTNVLDSVEMYRRLLSDAVDDSITIYAAGPLFNLQALLQTGPDQYSSSTGRELLERKVRAYVFMGGYFPGSRVFEWYIQNTSGAEWNWWAFGSRNTTRTVLSTIVGLGKPVTYVGAEQGQRVPIGRELAAKLGRNHPTVDAFLMSKWLTSGSENLPEPELVWANPAYDELTALHVVEDGVCTWFDRISGRVQIDEDGANTWVSGEASNESYLRVCDGSEEALEANITDRITGDF